MRRITKNTIDKVRIVEVGLRDGLQNEKMIVPTNVKVELLKRLSISGLKSIEVGSFVSPKWVPQMADTDILCKYIEKQKRTYTGDKRLNTNGICYSVLTPNKIGLEKALLWNGINEVAIFGAASEKFSKKNINCSIDESLDRFEPMVNYAILNGKRVRGYVSCVLGCPFEGEVDPKKVADVTKKMLDMGCYEVSLGDTIGAGSIGTTAKLLEYLINKEKIPASVLAGHFHDTGGQALSNIRVALQYGVRTIDSSVSGLGGCPYAGEEASGNVATEDVLYMLKEMGLETGVNINKILEASNYIDRVLGRKKVK